MRGKLLGCLCVAALCLVSTTGAASNAPVRKMDKAAIPDGFAVGSGVPPLSLKVEVVDGKVVSAVVADTASGNVTAAGETKDGEATLSIRHQLDVSLKFDLYISADGEVFHYASSCAVTPGISSFELWQQPIRAFALGNARVVPKGRLACE